MTDPTTRQVGGDHYLKLGMQPFHFSLANGWDGGSHTILKYVSRHHNVEREEAIESLRKAYHIVEIIDKAWLEDRFLNTAQLMARHVQPMRISVSEYCKVNELGDLESKALLYLALWLLDAPIRIETENVVPGPAMVKNAIEDILINRYGVSA